jgi:hypothetical protein
LINPNDTGGSYWVSGWWWSAGWCADHGAGLLR